MNRVQRTLMSVGYSLVCVFGVVVIFIPVGMFDHICPWTPQNALIHEALSAILFVPLLIAWVVYCAWLESKIKDLSSLDKEKP